LNWAFLYQVHLVYSNNQEKMTKGFDLIKSVIKMQLNLQKSI
jgi:hypothetical protein